MSKAVQIIKSLPFLWALVAIALLTGMDATVKGLSANFSTWQIVFLRFALGAILVGSLAIWLRSPWPSLRSWRNHAVRAVLIALTATSFFYAVGQMPLAELFVIVQSAPIFVVIFARIFLKERAGPGILFAIAAGFLGILVIVFGDMSGNISLNYPPLALAAALVAPVSYALSIVTLRAQTAHDPITVILSAQSILVALMVSPMAFSHFTWPTGIDVWTFGGIAILGTIGQLLYVGALKQMEASKFTVAEYSGMLWSVLFGYVFFSEIPRPAVWVGTALIIGSCLIILKQRKETPAPPAEPTVISIDD